MRGFLFLDIYKNKSSFIIMNYFKTERKAIYETAIAFTEFGWFFKEQPTGDIGIDAILETPIDKDTKVKLFGLQIKGGKSHFHRKQNCLTFYFSERHYLYWNSISLIYPILIIIQDPESNKIYWEQFSKNKAKKTNKHWKIDIPLENILDETAKDKILSIWDLKDITTRPNRTPQITKQQNLNFEYFLNKKDGGLYLKISTLSNSATIDFKYKPKNQNWDSSNSSLKWDDVFYYSCLNFEKYINSRYQILVREKTSKPFTILTKEINQIARNGIEKVSEFLFDYNNKNTNISKYAEFIEAYEKHIAHKRVDYIAQALDSTVLFETKDGMFEINTYNGKAGTLKNYIDNRFYDAILLETEEYIWSEIYVDSGIDKAEFIPVLLNEWEIYWDKKYEGDSPETSHISKIKEQSLRKLNKFCDLYNDVGDIIKLAYDFDPITLYPITVITMMSIFDPESCYLEYCEYEFYGHENWETIDSKIEDVEAETFFIRSYQA